MYHENTYQRIDEVEDDIEAYDQRVSDYYSERTEGKRDDKWSGQVINMLSKKQRLDVDEVLKEKGFLGQ